jgi:hypothetical protein
MAAALLGAVAAGEDAVRKPALAARCQRLAAALRSRAPALAWGDEWAGAP